MMSENKKSQLRISVLFIFIPLILICTGCGSEPTSIDQSVPDGLIPIEQKSISLNGDWSFSTDPDHIGEDQEWFNPKYDADSWQSVSVPHTWNVMDDYYDLIGEAWYRLSFLPEVETDNAQVFLNFEAVYYKADVWLNGVYLGVHEGGYTPFRFDISNMLTDDSENILVVKVDNYRRFNRVPDDVFGWWPYGGIVRDVSIEGTSKVYIDQQQIIASPHITGWDQADSAEVSTRITINNTASQDFEGVVRANILDEATSNSILADALETSVRVPAGESSEVEIDVPVDSPALWHFDHPNLYVWETVLLDQNEQVFHIQEEIFGIRSIELADGQFVLNGEPVRLVGMTRHADSPEFGLAEPVSFMTADYDEMKRLNMVLSRPVHYPQDEDVLAYCDRNGILFIPEIPAWQIETTHLRNEHTLATAHQQFAEMIQSSYNHPSIWAWSVGNEIDSNTPQGRSYVEGLVELGHQLDPSRPVSFASFRLFSDQERDATALTDFVLMNEYAGSWHGSKEDLPNFLDRIHALWPDRVVIISALGLEAGWSAATWLGDTSWMNNDSYYYIEPGTPEYSEEVFTLRSQLKKDQMEVFRSRPYVAGAIFWTYRDYRSDMNFRMGLYDINLNPTSVIEVIREQYSPIRSVSLSILETEDVVSIGVLTRGPIESDMPVYTLRDYKLRWSLISEDGQVLAQNEIELPDLAPAEEWSGDLPFGLPNSDFLIEIEIIRPTGFSVGEYVFANQGEPVR